MSQQWPELHPPGDKPVVNTIFDFSDAALGGLRLWLEQNPPAIPISSLLGYQQVVQKTVDVNVFMSPVSQVNWSDRFGTGGASPDLVFGAVVSSGVQNAEIVFNVALSGGTWTFEMMHYQFTNRGIYTASITGSDGTATTLGTVDGYAAVATFNTLSSITGIPLKADAYTLKLKMATKNASSSNYFGAVQHIQFRKTA